MRKFVIGDIHSAHLALKQVLERSPFNKEEDLLITLGDICDGWSYTYECVEELLTCKNRIDIIGNHDMWFTEWLAKGIHPQEWNQGGEGTLRSYSRHAGLEDKMVRMYSGWKHSLNPGDIPEEHKSFFYHQITYYTSDKKCFVHGGFNRHFLLKEQLPYTFYWDRDLWLSALSFKEMPDNIHPVTKKKYKFKMKEGFDEVFIGHTATTNWKTDKPMNAANIWNLDTGAGFNGKLTIMDIDTHEYWQSDNVEKLYPDEVCRRSNQ